MRRVVFSTLGVLELGVAGVLVLLVYLSSRADMARAFTVAEDVTRHAGSQVELVRQQVQNLHGPEIRELAQELQAQAQQLTKVIQTKGVDFATVGTLAQAIGDLATGLDDLARSFQPDQLGKLSEGLGEAATYLEKIVPAAAKSADDLEKTFAPVRTDKSASGTSNRVQTVAATEPPANFGLDLAKMLRDTSKLKEVAAALRQARQGVDNIGARWPKLRQSLTRSATVLQATRAQLHQILQNRGQYEDVRQQAVYLSRTVALMIPMVSDQIEDQLREQDRGLSELGQSIDNLGAMLPVYGRTMGQFFQVGRLLACLVAGIVTLHGAYLLLSVRMGRRFSF